jgi:hypothetical protein
MPRCDLARVVNGLLAKMRQRYLAAQADADTALRDVRQASTLRLARLRQTADPNQLLAGLRDPALTKQDREELTRFIAKRVPQPQRALRGHVLPSVRLFMRHARYHWRGLLIGILIACLFGVVVGLAARNTPQEIVTFDQEVTISFTTRDGTQTAVTYRPGDGAVVTGQTTTLVRLRIWSKAWGYATADINGEWFSQHAVRPVSTHGG